MPFAYVFIKTEKGFEKRARAKMKNWIKNKVFQCIRPFCCDDMKNYWNNNYTKCLEICTNIDSQIHFRPFCGEAIQIEEMVRLFKNMIEDEDKSQDLPWSWAY